MTEAEYEALERFSIITIDGQLSDIDAIYLIAKEYGRDRAEAIWNKYVKK